MEKAARTSSGMGLLTAQKQDATGSFVIFGCSPTVPEESTPTLGHRGEKNYSLFLDAKHL